MNYKFQVEYSDGLCKDQSQKQKKKKKKPYVLNCTVPKVMVGLLR